AEPPHPAPEPPRPLPEHAVAASAYSPEAMSAEPVTSNDPFASLPRIRPFTEFELEPIEAASSQMSPAAGRHTTGGAAGAADAAQRPGGRRRREDADGDDVLSRILERERQAR
ncbi:MAG TPA: hypothetical protein VKQ07_09955, partial [Jatrophihabitantaceae bacterium]|nr:hypothetical protein [Jatrophihabitantaceae bacterium]